MHPSLKISRRPAFSDRSAIAAAPRGARALLLTLLLSAVPALPALAAEETAATSLPTTAAVIDRVPVADRSMLFAADVTQLVASQPAAATKPAAVEAGNRSGPVQSVLRGALALLGTPYRWGGSSTNGFDCSGLVGYVFKSTLGIELPRISREMASSGERVDRTALTAGDLVFFSRRGGRIDHVGIYVGNGQFVHAPRTGKDVTVSSLDSGYWAGKFSQARRVVNGEMGS